ESAYASELKATTEIGGNTNNGMNGVVLFNWTMPNSGLTRSYCLTNGFQVACFYTNWTWEARFRMQNIGNSFIADQFVFLGMGYAGVPSDTDMVGSNFAGGCGFTFKQSSSAVWRMSFQASTGVPTQIETSVLA